MEAAEFDAFYDASFSRIVGQVHAMIGHRDEAEECVQEAFVKAWSHRRTLDRERSPEAWVRTTAYRLAVSRWRRTLRSRRAPDRALQPQHDVAPPDERRTALMTALAQLPADQRRALVLHHLCDLSVAEVAAEVGSPAGTVKARLSRGRARLESLLSDTQPSSEGASHV